MSVSWNPRIDQRGVKFAIRESGFGRGRQVAPVGWAPGAMLSQRVSVNEFNRLLDSDNPTPPPPPASVRPWPYPAFGAVPSLPVIPTYVPAGPSPTTAFTTPPPVVIAGPTAQVAKIAPSGALPPPSSFLSGVRFSAWWGYHEGAIDQLCATQGAAFIRALRNALHLAPGVVWDADVQNALIAQVAALAGPNPAAWAATLLQLRNDLAMQRVSGLSLLVGIYATYYAGNNRRMDAIVVPPSTVLPIWGQAPESDADHDGLVCYDPNIESVDSPQGGVATAIAESVTGIRMGAGRVVTGLGTVFDAPTTAQGANAWTFLAAVVGVGVVLWAVTPSDRKNPQLTENSRLATLQQEVMNELHRTRMWAPGMRARENREGQLVVTGDTASGKLLSNVWMQTRIGSIAAARGYLVNDSGSKLTFEPRFTGWPE